MRYFSWYLIMTNYLQPLQNHFQQTGTETALFNAMQRVFTQDFEKQVKDLVDYGSPHLASREVVELFSKRDGLIILKRKSVSDQVMRAIYASWLAVGSKRGLGFLEFVLSMLWAKRWELKPIYHSIRHIDLYPHAWHYTPNDDSFATSRYHLLLSEVQDIQEAMQVAPTLRNVIPANIVLHVVSKPVDEQIPLGVACVARVLNIVDLR